MFNVNGQIHLSPRCFVDTTKIKYSLRHGILKFQLNESKIKQYNYSESIAGNGGVSKK